MQIWIDCNITLEKSGFSPTSILIIPRFILWLIFELLNFSLLLSFHVFVNSTTVWTIVPSPLSSPIATPWFASTHQYRRIRKYYCWTQGADIWKVCGPSRSTHRIKYFEPFDHTHNTAQLSEAIYREDNLILIPLTHLQIPLLRELLNRYLACLSSLTLDFPLHPTPTNWRLQTGVFWQLSPRTWDWFTREVFLCLHYCKSNSLSMFFSRTS